jgi:hypothetical protein
MSIIATGLPTILLLPRTQARLPEISIPVDSIRWIIIAVEIADESQELVLGDVLGEIVGEALYAGLPARRPLVPHVDLGGGALAHEHHGEPRRDALLLHGQDIARDLVPDHRGLFLSINNSSRHPVPLHLYGGWS